jgi:hypothetical protein
LSLEVLKFKSNYQSSFPCFYEQIRALSSAYFLKDIRLKILLAIDLNCLPRILHDINWKIIDVALTFFYYVLLYFLSNFPELWNNSISEELRNYLDYILSHLYLSDTSLYLNP